MIDTPNSVKLSKMSELLPDEVTTVAADQTRKMISCDLSSLWFPCGQQVNHPFCQHSTGVKVFGAVSDEREFFETEFSDRVTSDVTIRFL